MTTDLQKLTTDQLVSRFVTLALEQDEALLMHDTAKNKCLFRLIEAVKAELKGRPGDARRALLALYNHPNPQVRLKAAKATLAIAPERAREVLQTITQRQEQPQALDAGMTIIALDDGTFKPT